MPTPHVASLTPEQQAFADSSAALLNDTSIARTMLALSNASLDAQSRHQRTAFLRALTGGVHSLLAYLRHCQEQDEEEGEEEYSGAEATEAADAAEAGAAAYAYDDAADDTSYY